MKQVHQEPENCSSKRGLPALQAGTLWNLEDCCDLVSCSAEERFQVMGVCADHSYGCTCPRSLSPCTPHPCMAVWSPRCVCGQECLRAISEPTLGLASKGCLAVAVQPTLKH